MKELTNIQKFYKNKSIFITGGTGLVGKTLVEKLLRSCSQLEKITVYIYYEYEALTHVSTTWSHCIRNYTEEKVQPPIYDPEFLINLVEGINETTLKNITPDILDKWPNAYVFTKQAAEVLIEREKDNLPLSIVRIPAVMPSYREPIPGWVNSIQAVSAIGMGIATGSIKALHCDHKYNIHIVPTDLISNSVAWHTAIKNRNNFKVYNYSCVTNPVTRKRYYDSFLNTKYPLESAIWTPGYIATNSEWLFNKYVLLHHTIPAFICDTFLKIFRIEPRYQKITNKNNLLLNSSASFFLGDLKLEFNNIPELFNSLNAEDKNIFNFDVNSINWDEYLNVIKKGLKKHLK